MPTEIARAIGSKREADRLVSVGLWTNTSGGYRFHDWTDQAGIFYAETERAAKVQEREMARKEVSPTPKGA